MVSGEGVNNSDLLRKLRTDKRRTPKKNIRKAHFNLQRRGVKNQHDFKIFLNLSLQRFTLFQKSVLSLFCIKKKPKQYILINLF